MFLKTYFNFLRIIVKYFQNFFETKIVLWKIDKKKKKKQMV